MKFVLLLKQEGEGCDYTIGCGYKYVFFDAKDMDDALWQVRTKDREYSDEHEERIWGHHISEMREAKILPADLVVDAMTTMSKRERKEEEDRQRQEEEEAKEAIKAAVKEREAKERADYERLKKKFEAKQDGR
jgi:hypothetical protein